VKDGVLEHHWESADRKKMTIQIVIPCSKVKEVLAEMHGGTFEGHLGAKKRPSARSSNIIDCT
jgi:hypothetical protein